MLIAINYVSVIPLENLVLIRGHYLYGGQYALAVVANYDGNSSSSDISNGLGELSLRNLRGELNLIVLVSVVFTFFHKRIAYSCICSVKLEHINCKTTKK